MGLDARSSPPRDVLPGNESSGRIQDGLQEAAADREVIAKVQGEDYRGLIAGWQWEWERGREM